MAKNTIDFMVKNEFNPDKFRVIFRAVFALIAFIVGMIFITFAVFSKTAAESEFTGPVIGFILGTMITLILTYYFGSADGMTKKEEQFVPPSEPFLPELKPPDEEPIPPELGGADRGEPDLKSPYNQ